MKMDADTSSLPVFVDASGEAYYQEIQVAKKLLESVRQRFPNISRRHATTEEMPTLINLGMKPSYQKGDLVVTLVKAKEIHDLLERREKYEAVQRSKKLLLGAGSSTTTPTSEGSTRPPFTIIQLVTQALLSSENNGLLSSREITDWISNTYPYYQSMKLRQSSVTFVLSKYNWFEKKRYRMWRIVPEHETRLRENAYLPQRTSDGRFRSTSGPKVFATRINTDDETALNASASQDIQPADVSDIVMELVENYLPDAFNTSEPQRIVPEVMDIIDLVEDDVTAVNTSAPQEIKPPEVLCTIDLVEANTTTVFNTSPPVKSEPELLDTIDLIKENETTVNSLPSKEINKPETDVIDLVSDDENGFNCDIQCPICDAQCGNKEALGEHVGTHQRVYPSILTRTK